MVADSLSRRDLRPFAGVWRVQVVLPAGDDDSLRGLRDLVIRERVELEVELGAPVGFSLSGSSANASGPPTREQPDSDTPVVLIGPASHNEELRAWIRRRARPAARRPYVELDGPLLVIDAAGASEVTSALSLLRTAVRSRPAVGSDGGAPAGAGEPIRLEQTTASGPPEVVRRVADEIGWTYPAFGLRGIDGVALERRWRPVAERSGADIRVLQRWVAGLRDAHTAVRPTDARGFLPYSAFVASDDVDREGDAVRASARGSAIRLGHVPRWSAGWAAGARSGDVVLAVDGPVDPDELLATTGAERRTVGWFAGRRAMTVLPPGEVTVAVRNRAGHVFTWTETATGTPYPEPISWRRLNSGTGYVRVRGWLPGNAWSDALDAAFSELAAAERLIVDVRGNVGGNLVAALGFRDRFLSRPTTMGMIRFSVGDGTLAPPAPIEAVPASGRRWIRPVRFLLDRLSYSATEDALLGLRDLDHVEFFGEPSGGGSGRPRTVPLQDGVVLNVSTALTFENSGRCVEGRGLAVDVAVPPATLGSGHAVAVADTFW
ncbi:hypothetical protein G1H11_15210 [Phytoactinopolyspora alkaliphila]|uniref:Tail specific protease domain-containing protein n=1 Tax=Phytoactinopolyspora alkaliphila TaxID=1783498 RepID=A0A6N9YNY2_9ACTN|nr:S41 family peptidase [Phytoactinopolyspora alkaliphila]NED96657.1 hypothetical protein [Phytoactinopolyspora alkaliphila]